MFAAMTQAERWIRLGQRPMCVVTGPMEPFYTGCGTPGAEAPVTLACPCAAVCQP
jgi:hypothetical protein